MRLLFTLLFLASTASAEPLRVVVYNIHAGKDASRVDNVGRVASLIGERKTDIALLQEVDRKTTRSGNVDQLAELQRLTGMNGVFGKALDFQGGEYGIAVLSRWPVKTLEVIPLQTPADSEQRIALVVETNGLRIMNTHLDASDPDAIRLTQLETLAAAVKKHAPNLVGGDFNSGPESPIHQKMVAAGLRDAWTECGRGASLTYPADTPVKRIDYLYLTDGWRCASAEVPVSQASDHRPLSVVLTSGVQISAPDIAWRDAPASLPRGTKIAVLEGNPQSTAPFTIRVRVPGGSSLARHTHPRDERATVLQGAVEVDFGDGKRRFAAGDFYINPADTAHTVLFPAETILQITGEGPWAVLPAEESCH